ncbi:unnamed protein product, partial [Symbiodinium microadriaticum]
VPPEEAPDGFVAKRLDVEAPGHVEVPGEHAEAASAAPLGQDMVTYHLTMVDGSETELSLSQAASVFDACVAAAEARDMPAGRLRLVVRGQDQPLPICREKKLCDVTGGETDLLGVISRAYVLGPGTDKCETAHFEHYPLSAYASESVDAEGIDMELIEGQRVKGSSGRRPDGVLFGGLGYPSLDGGRLLMRVLIHNTSYAFGIGIGSADATVTKDPEHDLHFLGLYHGGHSTNVCAYARRTHSCGGTGAWRASTKLAVLLDLENGTMQCYQDLQPFGKKVTIKRDKYWPMVVLWNEVDDVSIAVDYL